MTRSPESRIPQPLLAAAWIVAASLLVTQGANAQAAGTPPKPPGDAGAPGTPATTPPAPAAPGAQGTPTTPAAPGATTPTVATPAPNYATERRFEDVSLTVRFPQGLQVTEQGKSKDPDERAVWAGKLGASEVRIDLVLLHRSNFGFEEPSEVTEIIGSNLSDPTNGGDPAFQFEEIAQVSGPFGYAAYGTYSRCLEKSKDGPTQVQRFTGLLENYGYALELRAKPPLAEADLAVARDFLTKGVAYDGSVRDPKWSEAEAKERWEASVQDKLKDELEDVLRTPHYIIMTNSSGGKTFAKKMEECYAAIRKVFPFDEVPERRLMPVFLFRTNDQYYEFLGKSVGFTVEQAQRTGGISTRDFYTTWYEAPGDPVHIHEATHQIFGNRLGLSGGGSWFQEGVANYISTKDNERGEAARAVAKGKSVPLADFMRTQSLIFSSPGDDKSGADVAGDQYKLAALFIEFMRESKFGKAKFLDWVHAVGVTRRNDVPAIEAATRRVYGVGIDGLEKEFVAYCKKR